MYTVNKYDSFAVLSVIREERMIQIIWSIRSEFSYHVSCFYCHSDGTWHLDPDSRARGARFESLLRAWLAAHPVPEPVSEHAYRDVKGPSEVSRIESRLKQEKMYRKLRKEELRRKRQDPAE